MTDQIKLVVNDPFDFLVDRSELILGQDQNIFQKDNELIYLSSENNKFSIKPLRPGFIRYLLAQKIDWVKGEDEVSAHPPSPIARALVDKIGWSNIRPLKGITNFPILTPSGQIYSEVGYQPATKVFFTGSSQIEVPDKPSQKDSKKAVQTLLDIVSDFPFTNQAHQSAWIAALLTPLARWAHSGNSPLVLIEANSPRCGKTSLVKLISWIINGSDCSIVSHTSNEDEERKRLLSFLRAGKTMALIDNISGDFGSSTLCSFITSRGFEDRRLGNLNLIELENNLVLFGTGNNLILKPDLAERSLWIRLLTKEEKPHLRSDFKYPNLFQTVSEKRNELLSAAFTILKAYIVAGSPPIPDLSGWGSFKEWSDLVRSSVIFAGLPDPCQTRQDLEDSGSDIQKTLAISLLDGWLQLQAASGQKSLTCREAYDFIVSNEGKCRALISALRDLMGGSSGSAFPTPHRISRHLREIKDRVYNGKSLRILPNEKSAHRWYVEQM